MASVLVAALTLCARTAHAADGDAIASVTLFAIPYSLSVCVAAGTDANGHNDAAPLYVPLIGPFLLIDTGRDAFAPLFNTILIVDGVGQLSGAALLALSAVSRRTIVVARDEPVRARVASRPMLLGKAGAGLGLFGSF